MPENPCASSPKARPHIHGGRMLEKMKWLENEGDDLRL